MTIDARPIRLRRRSRHHLLVPELSYNKLSNKVINRIVSGCGKVLRMRNYTNMFLSYFSKPVFKDLPWEENNQVVINPFPHTTHLQQMTLGISRQKHGKTL